MKIQLLLTRKKYAKRIAQIISILSKYGLASWLNSSKIDGLSKLLKDTNGNGLEQFTFEEKVRKACEELGPTFIKLGQILASRPDLIGKALADELSQLQVATPTDRENWVDELVLQELNSNIETIYDSFNRIPVASASIGQVHIAYLKTGEKVAVKILHEGIENIMKMDLEILLSLSELGEKYLEPFRKLKLSDIIRDFKRTLLNELNFEKEANNIKRFKSNFNDNKLLIFPNVFEDYSTPKILTLSYQEGTHLNKLNPNEHDTFQLEELAYTGADMYLDMIFQHNFYHADPHAGNLLLNKNGQLVVLDFGMVGSLDSYILEDVEDMVFSLIQNDASGLTDSIYRICEVSPSTDKRKLVSEIDYWMREYLNRGFDQIDVNKALEDFNRLINNFEIIVPGNLALLFKVLVQLDGTARLLHPQFEVMQAIKPYYSKIIKNRLQPKHILSKLLIHAKDWYRIGQILPKSILQHLDALNKGNINLNMQHKGLENSVNRLVLGIVAASLFLGSVLLWSNKVPPLIGETSILGVTGYVFGFILIVKLVRDIFKS